MAADQARVRRQLDALERSVRSVLNAAAEAGDARLVLLAADRLLLISERRAQVCGSRAQGEMEAAVAAEVAEFPAAVRGRPAAVAAILLARRMDAAIPSADLGGIARELRITLRVLGELAPKEQEASVRDDLRRRREERIAAGG